MFTIIEKLFALIAFVLSLIGGNVPTPETITAPEAIPAERFKTQKTVPFIPAAIQETDALTYGTVLENDFHNRMTVTTESGTIAVYPPHSDYICDLFPGEAVTVYQRNGVVIAIVSGHRMPGNHLKLAE